MITSFLNSYNPTWGDKLQEICCCQGWKLIFQSSFYMNEIGPRSRTIILHHSRNTRSQHLRCISLLKGAGNHFTTRGCHQRQHVHGTPPGLSMSTRTPPDGSHRATLVLINGLSMRRPMKITMSRFKLCLLPRSVKKASLSTTDDLKDSRLFQNHLPCHAARVHAR